MVTTLIFVALAQDSARWPNYLFARSVASSAFSATAPVNSSLRFCCYVDREGSNFQRSRSSQALREFPWLGQPFPCIMEAR